MNALDLTEGYLREILQGAKVQIELFAQSSMCDTMKRFTAAANDTPLIKLSFNDKYKSDSIYGHIGPVAALISMNVLGGVFVMFDERVLLRAVNIEGYRGVVRYTRHGELPDTNPHPW